MGINDVVSLLFGSGVLIALIKWLHENIWVRFRALCQGMQAMLRDNLLVTYEHYTKQGYAPLFAKQNFEKEYTAYHNLGKNGTMTEHFKAFMALPDFPPEERG